MVWHFTVSFKCESIEVKLLVEPDIKFHMSTGSGIYCDKDTHGAYIDYAYKYHAFT